MLGALGAKALQEMSSVPTTANLSTSANLLAVRTRHKRATLPRPAAAYGDARPSQAPLLPDGSTTAEANRQGRARVAALLPPKAFRRPGRARRPPSDGLSTAFGSIRATRDPRPATSCLGDISRQALPITPKGSTSRTSLAPKAPVDEGPTADKVATTSTPSVDPAQRHAGAASPALTKAIHTAFDTPKRRRRFRATLLSNVGPRQGTASSRGDRAPRTALLVDGLVLVAA